MIRRLHPKKDISKKKVFPGRPGGFILLKSGLTVGIFYRGTSGGGGGVGGYKES